MKRLILTLAVASLVLPAAALGKGPSEAVITGPGDGGGGITFKGCCEPGTPTMNLSESTGFFPAVFSQRPDPMLDNRPGGDLGPKYEVTYTVPGPDNETFTIHQDIYPYAKSGPVTYLAPGQPIFDSKTRGGWYQAGPELKEMLVAAGLPATPSAGSSDGWSFPTLPVSLLALMLLVVVTTAVLLRRRARPAAA